MSNPNAKRIGAGELSREDANAVIERFEEAIAKREVLNKKCRACWHLSRKEIHRRLLSGVSYTILTEEYQIDRAQMHRHYYKHLIPFMRLQLGGIVMTAVVRTLATRNFPVSGTLEKQYRWCMEQMDAIRRIQVDEIDTPGNTNLKAGMLNNWFKTVVEVRNLIGALHGKPAPSTSPDEKEPDRPTVGDFLTDEQKVEIAKAIRIKEGGANEKETSDARGDDDTQGDGRADKEA